jgi:hypothetical protein
MITSSRYKRKPQTVEFDARLMIELDHYIQIVASFPGRLPKQIQCKRCKAPVDVYTNECGFIGGKCEQFKGNGVWRNLPPRVKAGKKKLRIVCEKCGHIFTIYGPHCK